MGPATAALRVRWLLRLRPFRVADADPPHGTYSRIAAALLRPSFVKAPAIRSTAWSSS
jgi:hypothetical protein